MRLGRKRRRGLALEPTTEEEFARSLAFLEEAWEEGAKEAVAVAVGLCAMHKEPPPDWLTLAVACLVSPRYQHDMIHVRRWHLVRMLRAKGIAWQDVYDLASKQLADEGAACAPGAVRESYESVQRQLGA